MRETLLQFNGKNVAIRTASGLNLRGTLVVGPTDSAKIDEIWVAIAHIETVHLAPPVPGFH